jgi:para-nitrobenzyl esterase
MKKLLVLAASAYLSANLFAQAECNGNRYLNEVFPNVTLTSNITYGSNYNLQNTLQSLELDIYEPSGDVAALRPLILLEHGGSFMFGDKTGPDIVELAEPLARMGYVVASVEYRLGMEGIPFPGPDSGKASEAVWRAVADFKAAVRWFYKDVQANGNSYRIDTNRLFIGGVSAGAVSAVHYAYLDDINEMPSYIDTTKQGLGGGIEGSSGNPGYSSKIHGVVSVCGMIADTAWMHQGDEPIVSLHGTADDVVPYSTDMISVVGVYPIFEVDGSQTIHIRANELGMDNCFHTWPGAGHTPEIGSVAYTDTVLNLAKNFLYHYVCGGSAQCGYFVGTDVSAAVDLSVFPNPNNGKFNVQVPDAWASGWSCTLTDITGRKLMQASNLIGSTWTIDQDDLPAGIYHVQASNGSQQGASKVVISK